MSQNSFREFDVVLNAIRMMTSDFLVERISKLKPPIAQRRTLTSLRAFVKGTASLNCISEEEKILICSVIIKPLLESYNSCNCVNTD